MDSIAELVYNTTKWRNLARNRCPKTYEATREVNEVHFCEIFPMLETTLNWKRNGLILDPGSGCGSTTFDFILPLAEKWDSKIIALDNSFSMVEYSRTNYSNDRIDYVYGEITGTNSPVQGMKFDIILSLYTLQLVDDYRAELMAFHQLLADEGELFMVIVLHCPYFGLFAKLMEDEKWSSAAKAHLVVPDWSLKTSDEDLDLKNAFTELGFRITSWKREERTHHYKNVREWSDFSLAINSFAKHLPDEEYQGMRTVYQTYFRDTETKTYKPGSQESSTYIIMHYEVINVLVKRVSKD